MSPNSLTMERRRLVDSSDGLESSIDQRDELEEQSQEDGADMTPRAESVRSACPGIEPNGEGGMLPIEDKPRSPVGPPKSFGPRVLDPLFSEAQLKMAEDLDRLAPMEPKPLQLQ